jgi:hypothetical protein
MARMQNPDTILIFTDTPAEPAEVYRSGVGDYVRRKAEGAVAVSAETLKRSVVQAYSTCLEIIETLPGRPGPGELETVTFSLAINGEGQVGLLSTAAKVGTQVGLTFQVRMARPETGDGRENRDGESGLGASS